MSLYSKIKKIVVQSAEDISLPLENDSVSIIIIEREKSGVYSVHTATDISLEDTQTLRSLTQQQYTYREEQDG